MVVVLVVAVVVVVGDGMLCVGTKRLLRRVDLHVSCRKFGAYAVKLVVVPFPGCRPVRARLHHGVRRKFRYR